MYEFLVTLDLFNTLHPMVWLCGSLIVGTIVACLFNIFR